MNNHGFGFPGVTCSECPIWYFSQQELDVHYVDAHGLACSKCVKKFRDEEALEKHFNSEHGNKNFNQILAEWLPKFLVTPFNMSKVLERMKIAF